MQKKNTKKKLGVAKSQVESFASMVKITRRISPEDKASFLAESTKIIGKIDELIEYIEVKRKKMNDNYISDKKE